jgi:DNA-binding CsgD family transcriptional regulator
VHSPISETLTVRMAKGPVEVRATYVLLASPILGPRRGSRLTSTGAHLAGHPQDPVCSLLRQARLDAQHGNSRACKDATARALRDAAPADRRAVEADVAAIRGLLALGVGQITAAADHLRCCAQLQASGAAEPLVRTPFAADLVEVLLALAERDAALEIAMREQARAYRPGGPGLAAHAARCRALLAPQKGYVAEFEAALRLSDAASASAFEIARIQLCFGERLRRERRPTAAREPLRSAVDAFERMSATPWAARARRELDSATVNGRRRNRASADELTSREVDVATALAGGATVAQAAAQLFVSEKTVEAHITRVYRKLDVHNRARLVTALGEYRKTHKP